MEQTKTTLAGLSDETKISQHTILRARSSKTISTCRLSTLEKIAKALNCSPKNLFEYEKD